MLLTMLRFSFFILFFPFHLPPCPNSAPPPPSDNSATQTSSACPRRLGAHLANWLTPRHPGLTLCLACQSFTDKIDPRVKSNTTSSAVLSSQRRGQRSCSRTTPPGLSSHIQIPPGTFCSVSSSYLKNVYFFFLSFSRQIGVLYSSRFARSPPHLQNVKDLKARIKGTFLINTFFSLSASFFLKAVFHYF